MHTPYGQQKEEDTIVDQRYEGGDCDTYVCVRGGGGEGMVSRLFIFLMMLSEAKMETFRPFAIFKEKYIFTMTGT